MQKESPNWLGMILLGMLLLAVIGIGIGGYYLGTRNASDSVDDTQISPTPVAITDFTKSWKTYTFSGISMKYPPEWTARIDVNLPKKDFFDPNSVEATVGNGGSTVFLPTKFVSLIFVQDSTHTPKQFVDVLSSQPQFTGVDMQRKSATLNNIPVEFYKESGEGTVGYDIVASSGKEIVLINIPTEDPNSDPVIRQMLATFRLFK